MRAPLLLVGIGALALLLSRSAFAARRVDEEWDSAGEEDSYQEREPEYEMPPAPTPRDFQRILDFMLPPSGNVSAHLTGTFDEMRGTQQHRAVDFNYALGQNGLNMLYPAVYSPVAGEVTFSGGQYGTVKILDANGFSHEFLHLDSRSVNVGDVVEPGTQIGTMGGRGPAGRHQYARHVHYQLKDESGDFIDPVIFWS